MPVAVNKREVAKARTRQRAIDAARTIWAEPGSYGRDIRSLAREMGMSTGAIFANFTGKDDLWRAAFGTEPPIDSPLTRAAPDMALCLDTVLPILRDGGHVITADRVEQILARARVS